MNTKHTSNNFPVRKMHRNRSTRKRKIDRLLWMSATINQCFHRKRSDFHFCDDSPHEQYQYVAYILVCSETLRRNPNMEIHLGIYATLCVCAGQLVFRKHQNIPAVEFEIKVNYLLADIKWNWTYRTSEFDFSIEGFKRFWKTKITLPTVLLNFLRVFEKRVTKLTPILHHNDCAHLHRYFRQRFTDWFHFAKFQLNCLRFPSICLLCLRLSGC